MTRKSTQATETVSSLDDEQSDVVVSESAGEAVEPRPVGSHHGFSGKKVRVKINRGEGDAGQDAVFVALNDYAAQINRDEEVVIPVEVFNACIRDAQTTELRRTKDGIVDRPVSRFSYSMLGEVA